MLLLLAAVNRPAAATGGSDTLALENGIIKVALVRDPGGYREEWFAGGPGEWRLVALSGSESRGPIVLGTRGGMTSIPLTGASLRGSVRGGALELRGSSSTARLTETITLSEGSPFASITVRMEMAAEMSVSGLMSTYAFAPDGKFVATTGDDGQVVLEATGQVRNHGHILTSACITAIGTEPQSARAHDLQGQAELDLRMEAHSHLV